ncbi:FliM/FliN family flagellar motor switch protein [[Brevibacterium] frigoritolerans]|nr:FliM/FliN family flagellar motor switch protein [Peribacillus frigoritolerans]
MNINQDPKWLKDIHIKMIVELGKTTKTTEEVLLWRKGTTIKLEDSVLNLLRVYINNKYFAYGDVLRNEDGEMSLLLNKILMDERSILDVSKNIDL